MTRDARRAAVTGRLGRLALGIGGGALAIGALGITIASAALGRILVTPPHRYVDDIEIRALRPGRVLLGPTPDTVLPGRYALWIGSRVARLGQLIETGSRGAWREIDAETEAMLEGVHAARWSGYWLRGPADIHAPVERVSVMTELGDAPAWIFGDQRASTWCIQIHGRGVTRRETLRAVPTYVDRGIPTMTVSYRNDTEAPPSKDGLFRLGIDEWRDVDAAIGVAVARGAGRIILHGWSMGGAIALQVARKSRYRSRLAGIVLDSPVVSWTPTLKLQVGLYRMPVVLVHTARWLLESPAAILAGGSSIDFDDLDGVLHADALTAPILLLHSADDGYVPPDASRALAEARPDLVEYHEWRTARHTKLWNLDAERYDAEIGAWLAEHELAPAAPARSAADAPERVV